MRYSIRPFEHTDLDGITVIYRDSIMHTGPGYYSPVQVAAWAGFADDMEAFSGWIDNSTSFVAVDGNGVILGFTGYEKTGRISSLFVAPGNMRSGIGSALLGHLLERIQVHRFPVLTTDASEFSRRLFERFGFRVERIEHTRFNGVDFQRYQMVLHN